MNGHGIGRFVLCRDHGHWRRHCVNAGRTKISCVNQVRKIDRELMFDSRFQPHFLTISSQKSWWYHKIGDTLVANEGRLNEVFLFELKSYSSQFYLFPSLSLVMCVFILQLRCIIALPTRRDQLIVVPERRMGQTLPGHARGRRCQFITKITSLESSGKSIDVLYSKLSKENLGLLLQN